MLGVDEIAGYDPSDGNHGCYFDEKAATDAIDFIEKYIVHVKGSRAGKKLHLEDWQKAIVRALFGWKRPNGTRRYKEVFVYVPRKNGKTTLGAAIALLTLFTDGEPGAECYCAAADRDQALLVFNQAAQMVRSEPEMDGRAVIYISSKTITYTEANSFLKAISADAATKHGYNSHFVINDELHAQPNRDLVDVLQTSTGSRDQAIILHITTADFDRPSICNEKHDYACKVRDGLVEDYEFLPVIYEASVDAAWTDEKTWEAVNPNIDVSISREYLRRECRRAQETPSYENTFKRLHLNIKTEQSVRWLQLDAWDKCDGKVDPPDNAICYMGLDLSTTIDNSSAALFFPEHGNGVLMRYWCPKEAAYKRTRKDRVPYETWGRQGHLDLTRGNVIDYGYIRNWINEACKKYDVRLIGYDPWNARQLALQLQDEDGLPVVEFRQGYISMNEPTKRFEAMIISGAFRHGGHPVLRWNAANVAVDMDPSGNLKPSKKSSFEKIDGIVATVMAIGCWMSEVKKKPSKYETERMDFF